MVKQHQHCFTISADVCSAAVVVDGGLDVCTPAGTPGTPIATGVPVYAWAIVLDDAAAAVSGELVTFSLQNAFGALVETTAISDVNGQASVTLYAGADAGAGTVRASADPAVLLNITSDASFQTDGGDVSQADYAISSLMCDALDDITCSGSNIYGTAALPLTAATGNGFVHALVTDLPGLTPQAGVLVDFALSNTVGTLISTSALTDIAGLGYC